MLYHVWQEAQNISDLHSFGEFSSHQVKRLMQALAHPFCFCPKQRPHHDSQHLEVRNNHFVSIYTMNE